MRRLDSPSRVGRPAPCRVIAVLSLLVVVAAQAIEADVVVAVGARVSSGDAILDCTAILDGLEALDQDALKRALGPCQPIAQTVATAAARRASVPHTQIWVASQLVELRSELRGHVLLLEHLEDRRVGRIETRRGELLEHVRRLEEPGQPLRGHSRKLRGQQRRLAAILGLLEDACRVAPCRGFEDVHHTRVLE